MAKAEEVEVFIREGRESTKVTEEQLVDELAQEKPQRKRDIRPAVAQAIMDGRIEKLPRGFRGVPNPRRRDSLVRDPMDR